MEASAELNSVITQLAHLTSVLQSALISSVILALLIAVIVELIKVVARIPFYRWLFGSWWNGLIRIGPGPQFSPDRPSWIDEKIGRVDLPDFPHGQDGVAMPVDARVKEASSSFARQALRYSYLPRNLFMKKLENMSQRILEAPALHHAVFLVLSAGTNSDDQSLALKLDFLSRTDPKRLDAIKVFERDASTYPPIVLAAQERVAAAIDRNLDDLQLGLAQLWPAAVRIASVAVGITGSLAIGLGVAGLRGLWPTLLLIMIGVSSGLLAPILRDIVGLVTRSREGQG